MWTIVPFLNWMETVLSPSGLYSETPTTLTLPFFLGSLRDSTTRRGTSRPEAPLVLVLVFVFVFVLSLSLLGPFGPLFPFTKVLSIVFVIGIPLVFRYLFR